jgi:hypothetical protein
VQVACMLSCTRCVAKLVAAVHIHGSPACCVVCSARYYLAICVCTATTQWHNMVCRAHTVVCNSESIVN